MYKISASVPVCLIYLQYKSGNQALVSSKLSLKSQEMARLAEIQYPKWKRDIGPLSHITKWTERPSQAVSLGLHILSETNSCFLFLFLISVPRILLFMSVRVTVYKIYCTFTRRIQERNSIFLYR